MTEPPKKPKKRLSEAAKRRRIESSRARDKTRINVGSAFRQWRELRHETDCKTDADLALLVLGYYSGSALGNKQSAQPRPLDDLHPAEPVSGGLSDGATVKDSQHKHVGRQSVQQVRRSNIPEGGGGGGGGGDATVWRSGNTGAKKLTSSLSVGDGCFMVDLANPSELLVDEECLLQLFQSCHRCNSQCDVSRAVQGLKVTVSQDCRCCGSSQQWSNL